MKIGMITDSLGALSFDDLLGTAAELGIEAIGVCCRQLVASPAPDA
jgi:sugar phosphate isomerase/epimerase